MKNYCFEQINVSDDSYELTTLAVANEQKVKTGDSLFTYESSKADMEVVSESEGIVYLNPQVKLNENFPVGFKILIVLPEGSPLPDDAFLSEQKNATPALDNSKRISKKALKLIEQHNIDVNAITGSVITEELVLAFIEKNAKKTTFQDVSFYYQPNHSDYFKDGRVKKLAIIGGGKAAMQLLDAVWAGDEFIPVRLYDGNQHIIGKTMLGLQIHALNLQSIASDFEHGVFDEIIISFSGNIEERAQWFEKLTAAAIPIANVFHPTCYKSKFYTIGKGNIFFAFTRIGPFVEIGDNNVISSYCSFEHHNRLGNCNTFGPSVIFSGSCTIGSFIKFGTGIFIEPRIEIGDSSIIASGCIVQKNIPSKHVLRNQSQFTLKSLDKHV